MPQEYTPSGSSITYTIPSYSDTVDADTLFKALVDDVAAGVTAALSAAQNTAVSTRTTSYTLALEDRSSVIKVNAASGVTITIPANTGVAFPVGTTISIIQAGAGQITVAGAAGVTVKGALGFKSRGADAMLAIIKTSTDEWYVAGDTAV